MDWRCGSSSRALARQVRSPEFKPHYSKKKKFQNGILAGREANSKTQRREYQRANVEEESKTRRSYTPEALPTRATGTLPRSFAQQCPDSPLRDADASRFPPSGPWEPLGAGRAPPRLAPLRVRAPRRPGRVGGAWQGPDRRGLEE
jgi:hypothetical protein